MTENVSILSSSLFLKLFYKLLVHLFIFYLTQFSNVTDDVIDCTLKIREIILPPNLEEYQIN